MASSASLAAVLCLLSSFWIFAVAGPAAPPAGNVVHLTVRNRGQQLYLCNDTTKTWTAGPSWGDLFHSSDKNYTRRIGMHYYLQYPDAYGGRQSWLISRSPMSPDSVAPHFTITGKVIEETPTSGQLDALLLQATSFSGHTRLSYIQRVPVSGGLPPASNLCTKSGDALRVNYESNYVFFSQITHPGKPAFSNATSNSSVLLGSYFAEGLQSYAYENSSWVLKGAYASLSSLPGREVVGSHYFLEKPDVSGGRATWSIYSPFLSTITAKLMESVPNNNSSVPLLRLEKSSSSGLTQGLAGATRVERLSTRGGLPPSTPGKNGDKQYSPYTAIYWFYT